MGLGTYIFMTYCQVVNWNLKHHENWRWVRLYLNFEFKKSVAGCNRQTKMPASHRTIVVRLSNRNTKVMTESETLFCERSNMFFFSGCHGNEEKCKFRIDIPAFRTMSQGNDGKRILREFSVNTLLYFAKFPIHTKIIR